MHSPRGGGLSTSQANAFGRYSQLIIVIIANLQIDMKLISAPWTWMLDADGGLDVGAASVAGSKTGLLWTSAGQNKDAKSGRRGSRHIYVFQRILYLMDTSLSLK